MVDPFSLAISTLSLAVATTTAWLTLFRRGTVKMTQPTVIYFGPDHPRSQEEIPLPKIYLRTLLFTTSKRGRVIESMHVALSRNEMHQNFNIWVYGERGNLVRGSGLFVGEKVYQPITILSRPRTVTPSASQKATTNWSSLRSY
jgi:hypothetical protein